MICSYSNSTEQAEWYDDYRLCRLLFRSKRMRKDSTSNHHDQWTWQSKLPICNRATRSNSARLTFIVHLLLSDLPIKSELTIMIVVQRATDLYSRIDSSFYSRIVNRFYSRIDSNFYSRQRFALRIYYRQQVVAGTNNDFQKKINCTHFVLIVPI